MNADVISIRNWLLACCGLVFLMVIVGAITRLTQSGLSIAEWKPLMGAMPPLSETEWNRVFELYKQSPEFQKKNFWMEIGDFKEIFFWEWTHRFLGRLIGLVYGAPLLWFWVRGKIPQGYKLKLLAVFVLGGLQGALGWYMVKSGLVDRPDVSHFRLAAHLGLALVIFCAMLWLGLSLKGNRRKIPDKILFIHGACVFIFLCATICWGAFTAGLDAGLLYNDSFPKMGGQWAPPDLWHLSPPWWNFLENPSAVQFTHRWLAIITALLIWDFWAHAMLRKKAFPEIHALALIVFLQAGLGIATLLSGVAIPLALMHQAGAVILLGVFTASLRVLRG